MKHNGRIITISGIDGTGKATQTKLLVNRALAEGYEIKTMSFPQYGEFWGKRVKEYLSGKYGSLDEINPKDASILFALDRFDAKPKIERWLNQGYNIIFDRYIESNFAHQGAKQEGDNRKELIDWLYDFEINKLELPESSIVVYLDLPLDNVIEAIQKRKLENKNITKDLHEEDIEHLKKTKETYDYLIENFKNWKKIACLDEKGSRISKENLSEIVWETVNKYLLKK